MKLWKTWFLLFLKRFLKSPAFCIVLCLPVLISILYTGMSHAEEKPIKIGLVWQEESELSQEAGTYLTQREGAFQYKRYLEEKELVQAVKSREIECGYIFPVDLELRLDKQEMKKSIRCIESPATIFSKVTDETVFSAVFRQYSKKMAVNYAIKNDASKIAEAEIVAESFERNIRNGETFSFQYETLEGEPIEKNGMGILLSPIRGMGAVLILIGAMMGAMRWSRDKKRGLFVAMTPEFRINSVFLSVLAPAFLLGVSVLIAIFIAEENWQGLKEFYYLIIYLIAVAGFSAIACYLGRKEENLCSLLPILTLGSFLFCPIFFRISDIFPLFRILEKLFLPYYYLEAVTKGGSFSNYFLVISLFLVMVGIFIGRKIEGINSKREWQ